MFDFNRNNHLKSKVEIDQLFLKGKVIKSGSIRLIFQCIENHSLSDVQVLISVPKRRFKLAVKRNRIRRLISEAYRTNAAELRKITQQKNTHLNIAIIYTGKEVPHFGIVKQSVEKALIKLTNQLATS